tara:strand:- start:1091 stop:2038 length:948 start_codon:yes stop_codon:yes gene_type:complete
MNIAISTSSFDTMNEKLIHSLEKFGVNVKQNPLGRRLTESEIIDHLNGIDGLLAGLEPLNQKVFNKNPQLKAIARVGIGLDNVDLSSAQLFGIKVSNTPEAPTNAVAEMTVAASLMLSRNILSANEALHRKEWKKSIGVGLNGSEVLIIGYGRIGRRTAQLLYGLGASIKVYDPNINQNDIKDNEVFVNLESGLKTADIVTLHASGTDIILGSKEFKIMKKGVIILNSSRSGLIDEDSFIDALLCDKVASAWMDVFQNEPYKGRLTDFSQILLTPHMSTYTKKCRLDMELCALKNLFYDLGIRETYKKVSNIWQV